MLPLTCMLPMVCCASHACHVCLHMQVLLSQSLEHTILNCCTRDFKWDAHKGANAGDNTTDPVQCIGYAGGWTRTRVVVCV